jgi:hypothetical protein
MEQKANLKQKILVKLAELQFLKNNGQICEFQPTSLDIDDQDLKDDRRFYQLLNNIPPPAKKARLDESTKPAKDDSSKERPASPVKEDSISPFEEPSKETPVEQPNSIPEDPQNASIAEHEEITPQDSHEIDAKVVLETKEEQQPIIVSEEPLVSTPEVTVTDKSRDQPDVEVDEHPKEESPTRISKAVETIVTPAATLIAENHQRQHERVQHESDVQSRVAELRKLGLWSLKRLPKLQEPPRPKTHWDFLLEEAKWLHNDYRMERKWKRDAARRVAYAAYRFVNNKRTQEERIKKEKIQHIRKIAATLSKDIRTFWSSIEKIVDYRQQAKLEETRKKAYGLHLNYILDQTSKFSHRAIDDQPQQPQQFQQLATNQNEINYLINKDGDGDTDRKESVINVSSLSTKLNNRSWLYRATLVSDIRESRFLDEPKLMT